MFIMASARLYFGARLAALKIRGDACRNLHLISILFIRWLDSAGCRDRRQGTLFCFVELHALKKP